MAASLLEQRVMGREVDVERPESRRDLGERDGERLHAPEHTRRSAAGAWDRSPDLRPGDIARAADARLPDAHAGDPGPYRIRSSWEPCLHTLAGARDPPRSRSCWPSCSPPVARRSRRSRPPRRRPTAPPETPTPSQGAFVPTAYPASDDAPCDQAKAPDPTHGAYRGNLKRIEAKDASTVVFELCRPDVAFLAKIAAPAFAINDTGWLRSHIATTGDRRAGDRQRGQRHRPVPARGLDPWLGDQPRAERRLLGNPRPERAAHRALEPRLGGARDRAPERDGRRDR